ncbi:filamentous hemagglutinin N-terminal domain-containing protein [Selenomonas sp. AE3005]|uniref:filamentous hemagglutinin N-terminal domain-containing protein n=1 Tax=Selenomonas sp. AE3005 TaxID=1485543 RepID=UPI00048414FE|nr:filamentous hemagglutinin N-terminal domain-containing protein [Selenomonas sp. AE3005]
MKKSEFKKNLGRKIALALGVGMFSLLPLVQALPAGGHSDSATIKVSGSTMDISGAANNVINWQAFSIAKGETVNFDAGNYLNLVKGPDVSNIYGTLTGGGNIFLVNPNGIVFGSGAVINVGSLTASTAPIESVNKDAFLNGNTNPSILGSSVTEGSDISVALVNVSSANSLILNAEEVVLQDTTVLDKVANVIGADTVIIGGVADNYTSSKIVKGTAKIIDGVVTVTPIVKGATLVTDLSQITNMNGKYLLAGDVDLSSASFTTLGAAGEELGSMATPFTGYFNGLGYTVNKLSGSNGLFAQIGNFDFNTSEYSGGTVKNLRLENVDITGSGYNGTGALAGSFVDGVVSNIYVSGNITAAESFTGGIVGTMGNFSAGFSAKLTNVENTATVTGGTTGGDIGGVVGMLYGGTITNAKNSGAVDGAYGIGGIVGQTGSEAKNIKYAYNTGAIKAVGTTGEYPMPGTAGGIVGAMEGDGLTINNAYNSGTVTGDTVGGIVGSFESIASSWDDETQSWSETTVTYNPTVTNSYYANVTNPSGNTYGTSVSAADLQAKVNAIWGGAAATDSEKPGSEPTTDTPTTPSTEPTTPATPTTPSTEPTTPATPTTPTADSQSGSSSRMDVIRDILTELMGSNMSSEQRRSMERDTENNIVAATSNPGRGDRPMAAMPTADTGAAAPAGDSSIVENTDKSAPTGGEVNSNNDEDEN